MAGYVAVALAFAWPLPLHLSTHLTGAPTGDTGVYVWNQWVFQHEVLDHKLPYFTDAIFSLTSPANLSLHNYTTFQNLVAMPLIPLLGVAAAFNVVYLLMIVLTAYATFLLARHVTGRVGEAWLAGMLLAWSPILVTRGMGHFSLVAVAPIAIFLLVLMRADGHERTRDAIGLGVCVAWATTADAYYGIYCLLIGAVFLAARVVSIVPSPRAGRGRAALWGMDALLICVGGLVLALIITDGWEFSVLGRPTRIRSLYTPMLAFTVLVLLRLAWHYRPAFATVTRADLWRAARLTTAVGVAAALLLSPVLYAAALRIAAGRYDTGAQVFWRSSPAGVDLLAFFLPNANHPLAPSWIHEWLSRPPADLYLERVASIPLLALGTLLFAWRRGWRPSRWWMGLSVLFGLLALGPFVQVAGVNTYVPGPWALLRYVPIAGLTRTPARFSIVMMLGLAVLFATAVAWLGHRYPQRRRAILAAVGVLLAFELWPAPLTLHSAAVPSIYRHVAAAPSTARLLELPFGVRDGTSSAGNFTARSQFFQTFHEKRLIGGYLSRVSRVRVSELRSDDLLDALMILSEGGTIPPDREARLIQLAPSFARRSEIAYVVVDRARVPDALRSFVNRAFRLEHVETDGEFELYRPR